MGKKIREGLQTILGSTMMLGLCDKDSGILVCGIPDFIVVLGSFSRLQAQLYEI